MKPPRPLPRDQKKTVRPLPDHSTPGPPTVGPQQYDPRTDPEVLANGMPIADARPRAAPAMDRRLPRSLIDWAKKSIRALKAPGHARKLKNAAAEYHDLRLPWPAALSQLQN